METSAAPPRVDLSLAGPRRQRRLTVFFRWILAIPHFLYLSALGIAGFFAVVAGWFAALVTGRLPDGLRLFVARVLNQYVRVYGYALFLLTDEYPPFALDSGDHDVEVVVHPPTRLNRAAVFFRVLIGIPAMIAVQILSSGATVVLFFVWIMVLVTGRMPTSVWQAMASVLRYLARAYAWFLMVTPEYPRGLFGDAVEEAPASYDDDPVAAPEPRITRLVLTKAARRIVVLTIVVGVVFGVGVQIVSALANAQGDRALRELDEAYGDLDDASRDFVSKSQSCALAGGAACLDTEIDRFAAAVDDFLVELRDIEMPESALPYAAEVEERGEAMIAQLAAMSAAENEQDYLASAEAFQFHAGGFDSAYERLHQQLVFS